MMAASRRDAGPLLGPLLEGSASIAPELDRAVTDLTFDSRAVTPGSVFFARRGAHVDASAFAREAAGLGAIAMVLAGDGQPGVDADGLLRVPVEDVTRSAGRAAHRFFGCPAERLSVIAVTGTNGKTSVSHFVAGALEAHAGAPVGVLGTLGQWLGGERKATGLTTPDCIAVHRAMAQFASAGARAAVLEASSHALVQQRLAGLRVNTAVFTNLTRDHLDYHGDMARYADAKALLFARPHLDAAVINADDPAGARMRSVLGAGTRVMDFSLDPTSQAAVRARVVASSARGVSLAIDSPAGHARIDSPLLGAPAAWNLLAAFCVLLVHEVCHVEAAELLSRAHAVPGRMQPLGGGDAPLAVVDYAHTPAALEAALDALRVLCSGRLWCVFGAGGERDRGKRALMGEAASRAADAVVVTDDNPRGEDARAIVADILAGVPPQRRASVLVERDRARAITVAIGSAVAGDVVLIAGKGHEAFQEVAGERLPFSDVAAVRAALAERGR